MVSGCDFLHKTEQWRQNDVLQNTEWTWKDRKQAGADITGQLQFRPMVYTLYIVINLTTDNKQQIRKWIQSPSKCRSDVTPGAAAQPPFRCNAGWSEMNWQRIHSHNVFTNPSGLILQKQIYKICRQTQIKQRTVRKLRPPYPLWSVDRRGTRANSNIKT